MYKKICAVILTLFFAVQLNTAAFEGSLSAVLKNDEELFFAYIADFESGEYLITASQSENAVVIQAIDKSDGEAVADAFKVKGEKDIAVIEYSGTEYILVQSESEEKIYTIVDDEFKKCRLDEYSIVIKIAQIGKKEINTYSNTKGAAYNLLNSIKLEKIKNYSFIDRRNSMSNEAVSTLRRIIVSVADIMSFDAKNCDADKLMKYVINTNENFKGIVPYGAGDYNNDDEIKLVNGEYIDYIISEIFGQEPLHPPVNELLEKGYCYNGSNYLYTDAFEAEFSTEVKNIEAVYDVGNDVYYVVFGDIYTENGTSIPEYSYVLLQQENDGYKILRLGMGEVLLNEYEIMSYAETEEIKKYAWEYEDTQDNNNEKAAWMAIGVIGILVAIMLIFYNKL